MAYNGKRLDNSTSPVYDAYQSMNHNRRRHYKNKKRYGFNMAMTVVASFLVMVIAVGSIASAYQNYEEDKTAVLKAASNENNSVHTVSLALRSDVVDSALDVDFTPIDKEPAKSSTDTDGQTTSDEKTSTTDAETAEEKPKGVTTTRLGVVVNSYDANTDYTALIADAYDQITDTNVDYILGICEIYEEQRNLKIEELYPETYETSHTFVASNSAEDIENIVNPPEPEPVVEEHEPYMDYTEEDAILLACIVYAEAGSFWITDQHQRDVASVVINRVESPLFAGDTIYDIVHAPGQYPNTCNNTTYDERSYANAVYVLENGPISDGIWQANFKQGKEVINVYRYGNNVTYICK